jgi:hypothetical protein
MTDPEHSTHSGKSDPVGDDRIDLSESFSHGAQMISAPPPSDSVAPQALLGTPEPPQTSTPDDD